MEILNFILPFIVLLTVVVFVHEYGHYYFARKYGVGVTDFSIGFGKEIFGVNDKSGTRWKFCLIPLGGYVKFFGDRNVFSQAEQEELLKKYDETDRKKLFVTNAFKTKGDNHDSKTTIDDIIDSEEMQQIDGDDFMSSKKTGKGVKEKGKSTYPSPQYVYRFFDDRHLHDEDALLHLSDLNPNLERAEHDIEEHDKYYPSSAPSRSAPSNDVITMNEYKEVDVAGGGDTYHVYIGGPKEESSSSIGNSTSNNNEMEMEINRRKNMSLAEVDLPTVEDVILVSYVTLYFTQNFIDFINCNQAKIEGYSHIEIFDSFIRNS